MTCPACGREVLMGLVVCLIHGRQECAPCVDRHELRAPEPPAPPKRVK